MLKIDFENMSPLRKVLFSVLGILYALAVVGNARHGIVELLAVTLAFIVTTSILFIWVK